MFLIGYKKMKKPLEFIVKTESALLEFLLICFSNKSRNYVKGILKRGQVTVDGKVCSSHSRLLKDGQKVSVLLNSTHVKTNLNIPVIYEDDDIIVIDKPAGMLSVSTNKEAENTVFHIINDYIIEPFLLFT